MPQYVTVLETNLGRCFTAPRDTTSVSEVSRLHVIKILSFCTPAWPAGPSAGREWSARGSYLLPFAKSAFYTPRRAAARMGGGEREGEGRPAFYSAMKQCVRGGGAGQGSELVTWARCGQWANVSSSGDNRHRHQTCHRCQTCSELSVLSTFKTP